MVLVNVEIVVGVIMDNYLHLYLLKRVENTPPKYLHVSDFYDV